MALRARHNFIAGRVADAFGIEEEVAKAAAKKYLPKLNEFLSGDGHAAHILAYYQPHDTKNEVRRRRRLAILHICLRL